MVSLRRFHSSLLLVTALQVGCAQGDGQGRGADSGAGTDSAGTDDGGGDADDSSGGTGGTDGGDDGGDDGSGDDGGEPTCDADGIDLEATAWELPDWPTGTWTWTSPGDGAECGDGWENGENPGYSMIDLTGDGRSDLVVTYGCDQAEIGDARWMVYENTGDGFATEGRAWALPDWPTGTWSWTSVADGAECGDGWENGENPAYVLTDLTGDGLTDLVLTYACDEGGIGDTKWLVYENTGDGFAADARGWSLPDWPTGSWSWTSTADGAECGDGWENGENPAYVLTDLTADGLVDLVLTYACDEGGVGDTKWLVYENTGEGFAADATGWSLPDWPTGSWSWTSLGDGAECGDGWENGENPAYTTMDLIGDERPDLVLTYACDQGGVGDERWMVYAGVDGGFAAEAKAFALPDWPMGTWSWTSLGDGAECGDGWENGENPAYSTLDVTGDGRSDLVLTYACDQGGIGDERWMVYAHEGEGFATDGFAFALPDWPTGTWSWTSLADGAECGDGWENGENPAYTTMDLDGNGALDLVVTYACDQAEIGDLRWMAYFGRCG